jgi:hypothetical protein
MRNAQVAPPRATSICESTAWSIEERESCTSRHVTMPSKSRSMNTVQTRSCNDRSQRRVTGPPAVATSTSRKLVLVECAEAGAAPSSENAANNPARNAFIRGL